MLTTSEIHKKAQRLWPRLLASTVSGETLFPYPITLAPPKSADMGSQFEDIRQWIKSLEIFTQRHQLQLEYKQVNHRRLGNQRLPSRLVIQQAQQLLNLLDRNKDYQLFCENLALIRQQIPELEVWLHKNYRQLETHAEHWPALISIVEYFQANPLPDKYLRALDIPGIDSKFIEGRYTVIRQLLDVLLSPSYILDDFTGSDLIAFCQRFGLQHDQPLIRLRWLDKKLCKHTFGLEDFSIPVNQLSNTSLPVEQVFITENKTNFLSFPTRQNAIVMFGQGYAIDLIGSLPWLQDKQIYYWGDIDTHGLHILDRLRKCIPQMNSLLMDKETLLKFKNFWGEESMEKRFTSSLPNLSDKENDLYQALINNEYAKNLRLEQERIPLSWLKENLD